MEENILILTPKAPADSPVKTKCVASNKLKWWLRWFITFLEKCHNGELWQVIMTKKEENIEDPCHEEREKDLNTVFPWNE